MIPKKIHYCWFGGNPLPEDAKKCIASWNEFCPDYEIKEWNESNFDLDIFPYVREAYDNKKFAFVTDVVRLYALYTEGGIYMDTDVEVLKPLDKFLTHPAFSGFENNMSIPTGIMAGEKGNIWLKLQLDYYNNRHFLKDDGALDLRTNVMTITDITRRNYKINLNNTFQDIGDIVFYPSDWFCPKSHENGIITLTDNSHTIHHFAGSWTSAAQKVYDKQRQFLISHFGKLGKLCSVVPFCIWQIKDNGITGFCKKTINKIVRRNTGGGYNNIVFFSFCDRLSLEVAA